MLLLQVGATAQAEPVAMELVELKREGDDDDAACSCDDGSGREDGAGGACRGGEGDRVGRLFNREQCDELLVGLQRARPVDDGPMEYSDVERW